MSSLRIDRHGHVTVFTLDRPEKRNAYDDAMMDEMGDAFVAFEADPEQYVGIVIGAGDAFCSGNDLSSPGGGRIRTGPRRFPLTDMFGVGATTKRQDVEIGAGRRREAVDAVGEPRHHARRDPAAGAVQ